MMDEMSLEDLLSLLERFEQEGIEVWIDGGWAVDALLGEQTRPHEDLDVALEGRFEPALRALLEGLGYRDVPRDDTCAWNYVLGDEQGHLVDVHVINLDGDGNGIYGPHGDIYPASSLKGSGVIGGRAVRCISAEDLVKFHTGYELDETDYQDVRALCDRFGIELPGEYAKFHSAS